MLRKGAGSRLASFIERGGDNDVPPTLDRDIIVSGGKRWKRKVSIMIAKTRASDLNWIVRLPCHNALFGRSLEP